MLRCPPRSTRTRYAGDYVTDAGATVSVQGDEHGFTLVAPGQPPLPLDPRSPTLAHAPAVRADIVFTLDTDGRAVVLTVRQYGTEIAAHRR